MGVNYRAGWDRGRYAKVGMFPNNSHPAMSQFGHKLNREKKFNYILKYSLTTCLCVTFKLRNKVNVNCKGNKINTNWSTSNYQTPAVIGHRRIVWLFFTRTRIASISPGGMGIVVNRKIRRKRLADDQEVNMSTYNKESSVWISKF